MRCHKGDGRANFSTFTTPMQRMIKRGVRKTPSFDGHRIAPERQGMVIENWNISVGDVRAILRLGTVFWGTLSGQSRS